jgi:hypothetical protein
MLSWSSAKTGGELDLTAVAAGTGETGVQNGAELLGFATACGERDDAELDRARAALVAATDEEFMVDAAGVAANFEMMTRLADATGARMESDVLEQRARTIAVMGVHDLPSRR